MTAVTFLFTDIEGSTHLWERHPKTMQAALAQHDALLAAAVTAHGGTIVKRTGDGCLAVFPAALPGMQAALAAQQALAAEPWTDVQPDQMRVRMALHTGEAEVRDGDYYGPALNRAARLMSIGHGGQILVSAAAAEMVRDQLPSDESLLDLGEHRLKDLVRPERVFQLNGPGLPVDFPALRSLDAFPNNLPVQLTSFIGREREMAEVKQLWASTHLLTLTGSGGTGKTRLALQSAAELLEAFVGGVWLVELASVAEPALVTQTVASTLGVREQPGRALLDSLQDYLRAKTLLLILDNCEHVIDACAQLASALLRACPKLKILASSREALGVAGETAYRVPSLALPDARQTTLETVTECEAARLFVERAQAAQPRFALTAHNLDAIVQITQRLDGIPLAIELAAARVKVLTAEQIAGRLDDQFRLLTGGSRTALPRQQTLRALIDWSYNLLSEPERAAWRQLSVFAGGWTLAAAEAVIGPDALDLLSHLVDKSLVVVDEQDGEARYRLLETIRQYGREKLVEGGESAVTRDRHLAFFLTWTTDLEPNFFGRAMFPALNKFEAEVDNIRAAVDWAQAHDPETALGLATNMGLWGNRGHATELRQRLRDIFARLDGLPQAEGEAARWRAGLRAKGLFTEGTLALSQGEIAASRTMLEASIVVAREIGETRIQTNALEILATAALLQGDLAAGEAAIEQGEQLSEAADYSPGRIRFMAHRATLAAMRGDAAAAYAIHAQLKPLLRDIGNPWMSGLTMLDAGQLAASQQDYANAAAYFQDAERLFGEIGDRLFVNVVRSERAHVARAQERYSEALTLYATTIAGWQELGNRGALAHDLECVAFIAIAQAKAQPAARLLGAAEAVRASTDSQMMPTEREEYDHQVAALRSQMGAAELAAAWAEGRALTIDEAVEFAIGQSSKR